MNDIRNRIDTIKKSGYAFDFSKTFSHALETYKAIALPAGLALLFYSLIVGALAVWYISSSGDAQQFGEDLKNFDVSQLSATGLLIYIVSMMLFTALSIPMAAGIMQMARNANEGRRVSFADAFQFYAGHYFSDLFFTGILVTTVTVALGAVLEYLQIPFIGTVIGFVFALLALLAPAMVLFGNLRPLESIRASFIVVGKEVLMIFLLLVVAYLIALAGLIIFCIGVIFTLPFVYTMHYSIYYHSVGFGDETPSENEVD